MINININFPGKLDTTGSNADFHHSCTEPLMHTSLNWNQDPFPFAAFLKVASPVDPVRTRPDQKYKITKQSLKCTLTLKLGCDTVLCFSNFRPSWIEPVEAANIGAYQIDGEQSVWYPPTDPWRSPVLMNVNVPSCVLACEAWEVEWKNNKTQSLQFFCLNGLPVLSARWWEQLKGPIEKTQHA